MIIYYNMEPDFLGGQAPLVGSLGGPVASPAPLVPTPLPGSVQKASVMEVTGPLPSFAEQGVARQDYKSLARREYLSSSVSKYPEFMQQYRISRVRRSVSHLASSSFVRAPRFL